MTKRSKKSASLRDANLEQRLRYSEAEFDALFDAAVDAVIEIDARGLIQRFNHAAEKIFGYEAGEVFGQNVNILMPEPYHSEHDHYIRQYQHTGKARIIGIGREVKGRHKDGSIFPIELSVGEVKISGQPVYLGLIRDISERKQAESDAQEMRERLAHVSRAGVLGEMASGLAHELNQPLTAIASYARATLRMVRSDNPAVKDEVQLEETLEKIAAQAERAGEIIRRLRSLIKRGEPQHKQTNVKQLIDDLLKIAELDLHDCGFQLDLNLAPDLPLISVDTVQIQQVLLNLIRNAMEAMREVKVGETIKISARLKGQLLEISVSDQGPGIADGNAEKLFEPFFTTKREGLGMGLALCRTIMQSHGGDLTGQNNRYGGARFTMTLPYLSSHE